MATKAEICAIINDLWLSRAHREQLRYRIQTRAFTDAELIGLRQLYTKAREDQMDLVRLHAPLAVKAQEVIALEIDYFGMPLRKQRRVVAAKCLREVISDKAGLKVPPDLSREAIDAYL